MENKKEGINGDGRSRSRRIWIMEVHGAVHVQQSRRTHRVVLIVISLNE